MAGAILLAWHLESNRLYETGIRPAADFLCRAGEGSTDPEICIAALVCAANLAQACGDSDSARLYLERADRWRDSLHETGPDSLNPETALRRVRFGLLAPEDPGVRNALIESPSYGRTSEEQPEGLPVVTIGNRAHYELDLDRDITPYLSQLEEIAEERGGFPERWLPAGEPGGSVPDLSSHAEYVRLLISQSWGTVCDHPPVVKARCARHSPD
ncbi:hypothetical protein C8P63_10556 [Melghirimyces profundicolus]|uniref:Uncharacterized protein n=2 Tax=Melghirimyces profundicolus TaxID=1242148 RepID=A0A2T6C2B3_9BACL|nr:hypothetical protein C8P63_10556 [Melghirimyces profundicolus]